MQIKDMFQSDINRPINPVVNVDDDAAIKQEIDEYVITSELRKHFNTFFNAYDNSKRASGETGIGVWISGFFGSGKSHFLKMLSYILENKEVDGQHAVETFNRKINDPLSSMAMDKCAANPAETILFNISAKSPMSGKTGNGVFKAFSTVFFEHMGFYGSNLKVARLELHLSKIGKLDEFKKVVKEKCKFDWTTIRKALLLHKADIVKTLQEVMGLDETQATEWFNDNSSEEYSIDNFVDDVKDYVDGLQGRRLVFMADEVGQYAGSNKDRLLELQTICEGIGSKCRGRVWVVCTAQEGLDELVKIKIDEFSRIQDRFPTRISLSSSSVDEVIQKRLLLKTGSAARLLEQIYTSNDSAYKNLFTFKGTAHDVKGHVNATEFVSNFPFVSYQYNTVQDIYTEVRKSGNTGTHLSSGERSLLSAFHQAVQSVENEDEFAIVPLYRFFDPIKTYLDFSITQVFTRCEKAIRENNGLKSGDEDVLKLLYLLRYTDSIPSNYDNIVILMADSINVDKINLKNKVSESLDRLVDENYISKSEDTYTFLNDQEQKIAGDIRDISVPTSSIVERIGKKIFGDIYTAKKFNYKGNNFDIDAKVDDIIVYGFNSEMSVQILTDSANLMQMQEFKLVTDSIGKIIIVLGPSEYFSVVEGCLKVDAYVKGRNLNLLPESEQKIIRGHRERANNDDARAKGLLEDAIKNGKYYVNGDEVQIKADSASACIDRAFSNLAASIYTDIGLIDSTFTSDDEIKTALRSEMQLSAGGKEPNSDACKRMNEYIESQYRLSRNVSAFDIHNTFSKKPYGWKEADIAGILAQLVAKHSVDIKRAGALIQPDNRQLCDFLRKKSEIGSTTVVWHKPVPIDDLRCAREVLYEITKDMDIPADESGFVKYAGDKFEGLCTHYTDVLARYQGHSYPERFVVEKAIDVVKGIQYQEKDPIAFIKKIGEDKDELISRIKNMKRIDEFFANQVNLFDMAERYLGEISIDMGFLKRDTAANQAIDKITEIVGVAGSHSSEVPYDYDRIRELNVLTQTVRDTRERICKEKRHDAKELSVQCLEAIHTHPNAGEYGDVVSEVEGRISETLRKIDDSTCISSIYNMIRELSDCKDSTISKMDISVTGPVPVDEPGNTQTNPVRTYERVYKSAVFSNKMIKSEEELDAYLNGVRSVLLDKIRRNGGIDLC